jgi:hypothetical protein
MIFKTRLLLHCTFYRSLREKVKKMFPLPMRNELAFCCVCYLLRIPFSLQLQKSVKLVEIMIVWVYNCGKPGTMLVKPLTKTLGA